MKARLLIIIGIIATTSLVVAGYLYVQTYDCLYPPMWMKIPRTYSLGDCLQKYVDGTLPDYTQTKEDYAKKQARSTELIERYKDLPEVQAFYDKYEDADVSVRDAHLSYFAGNEDAIRIRMNLYFDENYDLDYITLRCYANKELQNDIPEDFILKYLKNYECEKKLPVAEYELSSEDKDIISVLRTVAFDKDPIDGDVHYDRVNQEEKYWATLTDIKLLVNEAIEITFNDNDYQIKWKTSDQQENVFQVPEFEYTAVVEKGQTFVALCTETSEKQLHVLKYDGITKKDGIDYYTFWHKVTTANDLPECKYPEIIHYSLYVDFDLGDDPPMSSVWEHDWE